MKRIIIMLASAALLASGLSIVPAMAGEEAQPTEIPAEPNIVDPEGDANYHSWASGAPGPVTFTGVDIREVWFAHDAENLYTHIRTTTNATLDSMTFIVYVDPGVGDDCLQIRGTTEGANNEGSARLFSNGDCGDMSEEAGSFISQPGPEDTNIWTIALPRSLHESFADGKTLASPNALVGHNAHAVSPRVGIIDDTEVGTDYTFAGGKKAKKTPPGKNNPPGKKKGCKKGKGKKRGCEGKGKKSPKKGKPSASCASFTPGEKGADKPMVKLTDAATEEEPVEQTVTLEQSTADVEGDPTYDYFNVVVDSKAADAGLYATLEFPTRRDYDLELLHTDGSYAARSHGFNPIAEIYTLDQFNEGHGGHTTDSSESLVGIKTSDCGGWTVENVNWLGEGGELTVKLWLGEAQIDPQAEGEETPS